ncbi:MAG: hypothetical protein HN348_28540 [Proteobacteria bacterium]|nr:hypothetical protein [Pseudomonadota bacterium]
MMFKGEASGDNAGYAVSGAGDVDGDGKPDIMIGAPLHNASGGSSNQGAAYVFANLNSSMGDKSLADARLKMVAPDDNEVGTDVCFAGDTNGDGVDELLVGGPKGALSYDRGNVYLVDETAQGTLDLATNSRARFLFFGGSTFYAGATLAGGSDVDGDGSDDVLIGVPLAHGSTQNDSGWVYLFRGFVP